MSACRVARVGDRLDASVSVCVPRPTRSATTSPGLTCREAACSASTVERRLAVDRDDDVRRLQLPGRVRAGSSCDRRATPSASRDDVVAELAQRDRGRDLLRDAPSPAGRPADASAGRSSPGGTTVRRARASRAGAATGRATRARSPAAPGRRRSRSPPALRRVRALDADERRDRMRDVREEEVLVRRDELRG